MGWVEIHTYHAMLCKCNTKGQNWKATFGLKNRERKRKWHKNKREEGS